MASQEVFIMIDADRISPNVERAIRVNNPTKIARMGQDIERGNAILEAWFTDRSGKVLLYHGDEVYASVPGEALEELGTLHAQLMEAWNDSITFGVGLDLSEAKKALEAGKKRGGSRIVFYAPEIDKMVNDEESASDSHEAKTPSPDPDELKELSKAGGAPVYLGWFLDENSRNELLKRFPPKHENVTADHATWQFGPKPEHVGGFAQHLGTNANFEVTGHHHDAYGQAVTINATHPLTGQPVKAHVTLSTATGLHPKTGKKLGPVYSNELVNNPEATHENVSGMSLSGTHDHFPRTLGKSEWFEKADVSPTEMGIHAIKHQSLQQDRGAPNAEELTPYKAPQASAHGDTPVTPSSTNMAEGLPSSGPSALESQFRSAAAGDEAESARAEAQANAAQPNDPQTDQIKQAIVKILQKVKQQAPVLEQLKQQAPDAYQAIVASIQAMLMMAKTLMPQSAQDQQAQQAQQNVEKMEKIELVLGTLSKSLRELRALQATIFNDQATPEQLAHAEKVMLENPAILKNSDILETYLAHPQAKGANLIPLVSNPKTPTDVIEKLLDNNKIPTQPLWESLKDRLLSSKEEDEGPNGDDTHTIDVYQKAAFLNTLVERGLPPEAQHEIWKRAPKKSDIRRDLLQHHKVAPEIVEKAAKLPGYSREISASRHLPLKDHARLVKNAIKVLDKFKAKQDESGFLNYQDTSKRDAAAIILQRLTSNHHLPIDQARALHDKYLSGYSSWSFNRDPDASHKANRYPATARVLKVLPGSNKIRQIRDMITGKGGEITPNDLGKPIAQSLGNIGRLPNGNFSAQKIQEHLDTAPGLKLYATKGAWSGGQQHSQEASKVLRVSLPTEVTERLLKEHGVTTKMGHKGGHPGDPISGLGWIRWTGDSKGVHIDEVQHDFPMHAQKAIEGVLGHPIHRVLTDAFHEWVRSNGGTPIVAEETPAIKKTKVPKVPKVDPKVPAVGTPVHIWTPESKAPISGLDDDKPIPAHFQATYRQNPEKMGMAPGTYGELPTQINKYHKGKATYKDVFRKSLADIREAALAKAYTSAEPLQPRSTGIDNQVKVQSSSFAHNDITKSGKQEQGFDEAPDTSSRLAKIRKKALSKGSMMPEATNKVKPTPSGAMVARTRGDATPQAHKFKHIEPGEAAHVSMDGKVEGKTAIRQYQSGKTLPNEQVGEAMTGVIHPTSALDPKDGREKQDNQKG